ncbi:phosphate signaling complex protein PhoU [Phenylobacterium sp. SCN 70-31]|uniref:phosphate signaling complex protein PhoU n=1 Tax=Phenylobacterium sp. SCN 70-31 TaxID=1660129 RepID=UPI00086BAFAD|nr:phosphate signaling complex protein PhoU [Phenylobacterium sp. SCN 70-31]ODT89504.1 MAG: phosphate transport system regulatory protein PhoU [Phenylobacterium sp. SCN 70-31]
MEHTVKAVDDQLNAMTRDLAAMGDLAVAQVRAAIDVFLRHDLTAAAKVVRGDDALDLQDADIERRAVRFIALHQPMADDLRRPIAAMKIAMQLERCGDLAKNIAKRVGRMDAPADADQAEPVAGLGRLAAERLSSVVDAYRASDAQGAYNVWVRDTEIDELHEKVLAGLIEAMARESRALGDFAHLLFIAKNLERIGDHATNIAELVHYQITGADLADRPKL